MFQKDRPRKTYPSDLTEEQWAIVAPLIPPPKSHPRGGRPRPGDRREGLHTLCSLNRSGCPWEMVPHAVWPKRPVDDAFVPGRDEGTWAKLVTALRARTRGAAGRDPTPSAAGIERHSVKTTERGGPARGDDGGKKIQGRTRPLWVETLGVLRAVVLTGAGLDDGVAAPTLLGLVTPQAFPRLVTIGADQQYPNQALDAWRAAPRAGGRIAVQGRAAGTRGFTPRETRWVMERTKAWHGRYRRNSKDEERSPASRTAMIPSSHLPLRLHRLSPRSRPTFH